MSVESDIKEIIQYVDEIKVQRQYKQHFLYEYERLQEDEAALQRLLKGRTKEEQLDYYDRYIAELYADIDKATQRIATVFESLQEPEAEQEKIKSMPQDLKQFQLSKTERKKFLQSISLEEGTLKRLYYPKKKQKIVEDYTVYAPSYYGKLANTFFGNVSGSLIQKHPGFFDGLQKSLRSSDMPMLSKTYVSIMLFSSVLSLVPLFLLGGVLLLFAGVSTVTMVVGAALIAIFGSIAVFFISYVYPSSVVKNRQRMIKNDLPFAIIHMAAVAGSGAPPIAVFKLMLSSGEYKGLESEIKKIVNYVNLFGYDLSTALKSVATTTPSRKFADLLTGITSTIESGGSLKSYLNSVADETMTTYKVDRKKYVETLSIYSDIYTGVLIAAPLLFIVILTIINVLGGSIGGLEVKTIAVIGTYAVIPLLNVFFFIFLNIVQPEL